MEQYQHEIVTEQGIAVRVTRKEVDDEIYMIESDDERFLEVFGVPRFEIKPQDTEMENALMGQVVQYHQPVALEILEAVKKVI